MSLKYGGPDSDILSPFARGSQEHTPHPSDAVLPVCRAKLVGERTCVYYRRRTPANEFQVDPTALPLFPPSPEAERAGLRETPRAMPRPVLASARRESERASSGEGGVLVRRVRPQSQAPRSGRSGGEQSAHAH